MPGHGDGARFVQPREALTRFRIRSQCLRVAALHYADGPKLEFAHGDSPVVTELLAAAYTLFVSRRRFVEPTQKEKTVASFREADGRHPFRVTGMLLGYRFETLAGLVQQRQGRFRSTGRLQHAGQEPASPRQVV